MKHIKALLFAILFAPCVYAQLDTTLTITGAGNVGIGTTAPAYKLDVNGAVNATSVLVNGVAVGTGGGIGGSGTMNYLPKFTGATTLVNSVVYETSGKVGIRTTTPGAPLEVSATGSGNTITSIFGRGNDPNFTINARQDNSSNAVGAVIGEFGLSYAGSTNGAGMRLHRGNDGNEGFLSFTTTSTERLRIDIFGNVGIGTTAPDALFSVNGTASKPGGGSWSVFSDRRLKQDINPFKDGLSVINGIKPVTFRYNGKLGHPTDKTYVGVIAQEIQTVAPYTVDSFKAKLNPEDVTETDILRFDPNALTYISINAIKELSTENQKLRQELDELKAMVKSLAAEKNGAGNKSMGQLK